MRPLGFCALGGALLAALALVVLIDVGSFPSRTALIVVWLMPIVFGLHVCEEFGVPGGFEDWAASYRPVSAETMTRAHLWRVNEIGGAAALGVTLGVFDHAGAFSAFGVCGWLMGLFTLTENGLHHARGAVESRRYSLGVMTSLLGYLPLTVLGTFALVSSGAASIVAVPICAIGGIGLMRLIVRASRRHELPAGGGRHPAW